MSNAFANLNEADNVKAEKDVLGGGGPMESGLYPATITMAYAGKSEGGAASLTVHCKTENGELRETLWVSSGDAKGNKTTYTDKNKDEVHLPGYVIADALGLLGAGKSLKDWTMEEKSINLYNFDEKKEVPTKVPVVMDLLDKEVILAVSKNIEDKNAKGEDGKYHPTGETRITNTIEKVFRVRDKLTVSEVLAQVAESDETFYHKWGDKFTGVTRDRSTKGAAANNGTAGAPGAGATQKPTQSLFV